MAAACGLGLATLLGGAQSAEAAIAATFTISFGDGTAAPLTISNSGLNLTFSNPLGLSGNPTWLRNALGGLAFSDSSTPGTMEWTFSRNVRLISYTVMNDETDGTGAYFNLVQGGTSSTNNLVDTLGTFSFTNTSDIFQAGIPISFLSGDFINGATSENEAFAINSLTFALTYSPVYWTGDQDGIWTTNNGGNTNWAATQSGTVEAGYVPDVLSDVVFSADNAVAGLKNTTLGADLTIHSLTIQDPAGLTIGAGNTLTISGSMGTGIDVQAGAGLFTMDANLTLAGASNTITVNNTAGAVVNGVIDGTNGLIKQGSGGLLLTGANIYTGDTTVEGGTLEVTGSIANATNTYVGYNNSNVQFIISNGGTVNNQSGSIGVIAGANDNTASVTNAGSKWNVAGDLNVGFEGDRNTLIISDGGAVQADYTKIGGLGDSTGLDATLGSTNNKVVITGAGSRLDTWSSLIIGYGGESNALSILDGGLAANLDAIVGFQSTSNFNEATVSGAGSLWQNNGTLYVGFDGYSNTVTVENGGMLTVDGLSKDAVIGFNSGSDLNWLVVKGAGSVFSNNSTLYIGNNGADNELQVLDGALAISRNVRIGMGASSDGNAVTVDGAGTFWNISGTMRVGSSGGSNILQISNGGVVQVSGNSFVGYASGADSNLVIIDGAGSKLRAEALTISRGGNNNAVQVIRGGTLQAASITLGELAGSFGFLQIGLGGAPGTVDAPTITGGAGNGIVYFSHDATGYIFAPTMTGNVSVVHNGPGETILSHANTYDGETFVVGGTLRTQDAKALGSTGKVSLFGGVLALDTSLNVAATDWSAGQVKLGLGASTFKVAGLMHNDSGGGGFIFDSTGVTLGTYTVATFGTTDFLETDFTASTTGNVKLRGFFTLNGNDVEYTLTGATAWGPILQNSAPINIPTFADFIVDGPVYSAGGNNTVQTLTFLPGSSLTVHDLLTITQGNVDLVGGASMNLQGTLAANALRVLPGGFLHGTGNILGNLYNAGLVSPGNSPGTIQVSQNYVQTREGTLRIEIGGVRSGQHDLLAVGGSAQLDGTLQLVQINKYWAKRGDKVTFLTAGQGVSGEFSRVDNGVSRGTILEPRVVYHDNRVEMVVEGSYTDFAARTDLTPNQRSVARALDSAVYDKSARKLIGYTDYRQLNELPGDFDKIAPEELSSIYNISTSLAQVQSINLQRRTDDLRNGASGFSAGGLAMQGSGPGSSGPVQFRTGMAGPTGNEGKESKETKTVIEEEKKWGAFVTGVGEWVNIDGDGNARGYDITTGGFTLGLDYKVCSNFAVGIAAGYAGTSTDLSDNGRVWVNGGKLGVYATTFAGGWYADAAVTGGYNSYDTKRAGLEGAARGSTDGGELNVLFGTGYDWKVGALTIGPTAAFNYVLTGFDDYTEHGSLAPLEIHCRNAESITTALGFKASVDWKVGGVLIKPEVRAAWQHEYAESSYGLDASFANGAGNAFLVNGPETGRDSLLIGAGFAVQFSEACSTYLYYDGEVARTNYDRHSVSGGVRIAF